MIIWTIQPYEVYQEILTTGTFYCDPSLSTNLKDDADFSRAYRWMIQQMIKKIGPSDQLNIYPIWAWYRSRDYTHQRPDFRWIRDYSDEVCIELDISDDKVLLSDFQGWHFILNDWYYSDAMNQDEWDRKDKWFDGLSAKQQQQEKEKSWQQIFDVTPRYGDWDANGEAVQACFWAIKKEQIRKVWRLKQGEKVRKIYSV